MTRQGFRLTSRIYTRSLNVSSQMPTIHTCMLRVSGIRYSHSSLSLKHLASHGKTTLSSKNASRPQKKNSLSKSSRKFCKVNCQTPTKKSSEPTKEAFPSTNLRITRRLWRISMSDQVHRDNQSAICTNIQARVLGLLAMRKPVRSMQALVSTQHQHTTILNLMTTTTLGTYSANISTQLFDQLYKKAF